MAAKTRRRPQPRADNKTATRRASDTYSESDTYYELVKQFPLTHIRDDDHLAVAIDMLDQLLERDLDEGQRAYLDVLTDMVEAYEDQHVAIQDASEADVLRELMRSNGLTQAGLKRKTGIAQSTISAVLNGDRSLTKGQVVTLAKLFGVSTAAFMPDSR
jgi:HTH-type transcriptional regulator / antitoxin HigA